MKRFCLAISMLVVVAGSISHVQAAQDVYRWKDAGGVTHYGDAAPAGAQATRVSVDTRQPASAVASNADDLSAAAAAASEDRLQKAETAARQRNCTRARTNLQELNSDALLVDSRNAAAARRLSPEARAEAKKAAEANAATYCDKASP